MYLWSIFVLEELRLCLNLTYDSFTQLCQQSLHTTSLLGIKTTWGFDRIQFEYQHIYNNVHLLNAKMLQ